MERSFYNSEEQMPMRPIAEALNNKNYRKVLYTEPDDGIQTVVMNIPVGSGIDRETHADAAQYIQVVDGSAMVTIAGEIYRLNKGDAIVVPKGQTHEVVNDNNILPLKIFTIYSKAEHKKNLVQQKK